VEARASLAEGSTALIHPMEDFVVEMWAQEALEDRWEVGCLADGWAVVVGCDAVGEWAVGGWAAAS